jgi:hypothetical protein
MTASLQRRRKGREVVQRTRNGPEVKPTFKKPTGGKGLAKHPSGKVVRKSNLPYLKKGRR